MAELMRKLKRHLRALPVLRLKSDGDLSIRRALPSRLRMIVAMIDNDGAGTRARTMARDFPRSRKRDGTDFPRRGDSPASILHRDIRQSGIGRWNRAEERDPKTDEERAQFHESMAKLRREPSPVP